MFSFTIQIFSKGNGGQIETARIHSQKAGEYIKENNWNAALGEAKKAVQADPKYAAGHLLLGIIYVKLGQLDPAEKELKATMDLDSNIPEAYTYMGKVYYYRENLDKALEYYKKAVSKGTQEVSLSGYGTYILPEITTTSRCR